jgi:hypothetical protein
MKTKLNGILALLMGLVLTTFMASGCSNSTTTPVPPNTERCGHYDSISLGTEYLIANNKFNWNVDSLKPRDTTCIFLVGSPSNPVSYGWHWNWPTQAGDTNPVWAYPEIIYGWKPYSHRSTTGVIPAPLDSIDGLSVQYETDTQYSTGSCYDLAFDIWVASGSVPNPYSPGMNILSEIMIWDQHSTCFPPPANIPPPIVDTVGGNVYNLYIDIVNHTWPYLAFLPVGPVNISSRTIDILPFLSYLETIKNPSTQQPFFNKKADWLSSVEFGNEIKYGSGRTTLTKYAVTPHKK